MTTFCRGSFSMAGRKTIFVIIVFCLLMPASLCFGQEFGFQCDSDTLPGECKKEMALSLSPGEMIKGAAQCANSIYELPYSVTGKCYDWRRLWINTATLSGAFVGTLLVLECLPEDATSWNRAELQDVPLLKRWNDHVIKQGPNWDHDKFYFNYILHPYAGAAYFMAARSCGFNAWQSMLYCSIISNIGWEFGVEAFMERPSIQDMLITPLIGSFIGECFYKLKRNIVSNGYTLAGSSILGNIVAFLVDPVNEVIGLFNGNPARQYAGKRKHQLASSVVCPSSCGGAGLWLSLYYQF